MEYNKIYYLQAELPDGGAAICMWHNGILNEEIEGVKYKYRIYETGMSYFTVTAEALKELHARGYVQFISESSIEAAKKDKGFCQYRWLAGNWYVIGTRLSYITKGLKTVFGHKKTFKVDSELFNFYMSKASTIKVVSDGWIDVKFHGGAVLNNTYLSEEALCYCAALLMFEIQKKLHGE